MKKFSDWWLTLGAVTSLGGPDIVSIFQTFGPVLDGLLRLGQIGVAIATIIFIFRKGRLLSRRKPKRKQ